MKRQAAVVIGIMLATFWTNTLSAMEFRRHPLNSDKLNAIAATGKIVDGDSVRLRAYIAGLPVKDNTAIYFSSPGGNITEGLAIGYLLKKYRIKAVVEGDAPYNYCNSACALAFLGGHDLDGRPWRSSTTNSRLGFHQFYCADDSGELMRCEQDVGDIMRAVAQLLNYGQEMRASMDIIKAILETPPTHMHEFTTDELCSMNIKVWDLRNKRFIC